MSYKNWRNQEVNDRLMGSWGYKAPKTEILSENKEISHLCAMLVTEKTTGRVGHPINHTLLESGDVTHYDVEFDDIVIEGMPVEALNVEVQEEHMHGRREDYPHDEDKPRERYAEGAHEEDAGVEEAEELEEEAMPMKTDAEDADGDGETDDEVPAFLKEEAMIRRAVREAISKTLNK